MKKKMECKNFGGSCGCGSIAYLLAVIGSAVYYLSTATGFWNGVWGLVKALIWPAFLIFELLKFLGA